jgi:hypothetical protein
MLFRVPEYTCVVLHNDLARFSVLYVDKLEARQADFSIDLRILFMRIFFGFSLLFNHSLMVLIRFRCVPYVSAKPYQKSLLRSRVNRSGL